MDDKQKILQKSISWGIGFCFVPLLAGILIGGEWGLFFRGLCALSAFYCLAAVWVIAERDMLLNKILSLQKENNNFIEFIGPITTVEDEAAKINPALLSKFAGMAEQARADLKASGMMKGD